jgi:hypothetical protein
MKHHDNGRTYRLVREKPYSIGCMKCKIACPVYETSGLRVCAVNKEGILRSRLYYWRETLWSKIRNWRSNKNGR